MGIYDATLPVYRLVVTLAYAGISDLNFPFAQKSYALSLIGSCSDHYGVFWVASRLALAVPLTLVGLFAASTPASLLTPVPAEGLLSAPFGVSPGSLPVRQGQRRNQSACCRTASDSGALRPIPSSNGAHVSPAVRRS